MAHIVEVAPRAPHCPSDDDLLLLLMAGGEPADIAGLDEHLARCPGCAELVGVGARMFAATPTR